MCQDPRRRFAYGQAISALRDTYLVKKAGTHFIFKTRHQSFDLPCLHLHLGTDEMSCPDCFSGHVHSGTPLGHVTKIHGRDTYVSKPKDDKPPKGIIIIVPDAFGWEFVNNRILADHYADSGQYLVYLPEFMDGRPPSSVHGAISHARDQDTQLLHGFLTCSQRC